MVHTQVLQNLTYIFSIICRLHLEEKTINLLVFAAY